MPHRPSGPLPLTSQSIPTEESSSSSASTSPSEEKFCAIARKKPWLMQVTSQTTSETPGSDST